MDIEYLVIHRVEYLATSAVVANMNNLEWGPVLIRVESAATFLATYDCPSKSVVIRGH